MSNEKGEGMKKKKTERVMDLAAHEYKRYLMITISGVVVSLLLIMLFFFMITRLSARLTYETTLSMKKSMLNLQVRPAKTYAKCLNILIQSISQSGSVTFWFPELLIMMNILLRLVILSALCTMFSV